MKMKKILNLFIIAYIFSAAFSFTQAQYWEKITNTQGTLNDDYWLDIYFLPSNPQLGWICGFRGRTLRTTDGGNSWLRSQVSGADHLESIHFPSANIGYVSGVGGIYKSTNGGTSWFGLNLPNPDSTRPSSWGTYFVNDSDGMLVGGGCGTGKQNFWHTTDGGANWNLFRDSVDNTGLTDAIILQAGGEGYAVSSGNIWHTTDGGNSWAIMASTGSNVWHEEITKIGRSFLLPYSGTTCTGGGLGAGGMRFTTNNGTSWNNFSTNQRMFGTFLINTETGWACGDNRSIYYTEDSGQSWELKNCGIEGGNLDDIWFNSPTDGWAVGQQGVYHLTSGRQEVSSNELDFGTICLGEELTGEVIMSNLNMQQVSGNLSITGADAADFTIIRPLLAFTLNDCQSVAIRIRFLPASSGTKNAILNIEFTGGRTFTVNLTGSAFESTAYPSDTLLVINPAPNGVKKSVAVIWKAEVPNEMIVQADLIEGNADFFFDSELPFPIQPAGSRTNFSVVTTDTGWTYARFRIKLEPCSRDTFITVKAYGTGPIIDSDSSAFFSLDCIDEIIDTIPINNIGNADLNLEDAVMDDPSQGFSVIGWTSGRTLPFSIEPLEPDSIIVRFAPRAPGNYSTILRFFYNDGAKTGNIDNPYEISLGGTYVQTNLVVKDTIIDFGDVCLGSFVSKTTYITNINGVTATIFDPLFGTVPFSAKLGNGSYPVMINGNDSATLEITFSPDLRGIVRDTLILTSAPCDEVLTVIVVGNGIEADFIYTPESINKIIKTNTQLDTTVNVRNTGTTELEIISITLKPPQKNLTFNYAPQNGKLSPGEDMDFRLVFMASIDTVINATICIKATGDCDVERCIPVRITSQTTKIIADRDEINFGYFRCEPYAARDTITITNEGVTAERIFAPVIDPPNSPFRIVNINDFTYDIGPNSTFNVIVEYLPVAEENSTATISIGTSDDLNDTITVALAGEYRNVITEPDKYSLDFGEVETCETVRYQTITFTNQGTIADTLYIDKSPAVGFYSNISGDFIVPSGGGEYSIDIFLDPSLFPSTGVKSGSFEIRSRVCPNRYVIDVSTKIIRPVLSVVPQSIDFGELWMGEYAESSVIISNSTDYTKIVTDIKIEPDTDGFAHDATLPITLASNAETVVNITFDAINEGRHQRKLVVYSESVCKDTIAVGLAAFVPEEKYLIKLSIPDYSIDYGGIFTIEINLEKPVYKFHPNEFYFEINFDKELFSPQKMYVKDGSGRQEIKYEYADGRISGRVDSTLSINLFDSVGTIIFIEGMAIVAVPYSTSLEFGTVSFLPAGDITVEKENGSLTVTNFCIGVAIHRIISGADVLLDIVDKQVSGNSLSFDYHSTGRQKITAEIVDVIGQASGSFDIDIDSGEGTIDIDVSGLSSGIYFITFRSMFRRFNGKFIIAR